MGFSLSKSIGFMDRGMDSELVLAGQKHRAIDAIPIPPSDMLFLVFGNSWI